MLTSTQLLSAKVQHFLQYLHLLYLLSKISCTNKLKCINLGRGLNPRPLRGRTPANLPNQMPRPHHPIYPDHREIGLFFLFYIRRKTSLNKETFFNSIRPKHTAKAYCTVYKVQYLSTVYCTTSAHWKLTETKTRPKSVLQTPTNQSPISLAKLRSSRGTVEVQSRGVGAQVRPWLVLTSRQNYLV